jgi:hypothetical protein
MKEKHEDTESVQEGTAAPRLSESDQKEVESRPGADDFHPIKIKGEPLSATIIRERREGW